MSHILVVEDEVAVREAIRDTLQSHEVELAGNVQEALRYLKANEIDLLLVDLYLAGEDGMTIARYVRQQSPYVAIIILTGHGNLQTAIQALELEAQAYLLKPVRPDELESIVNEQIAKMRELRQRDELAQHMRSAIEAMNGQSNTTQRLTSGKVVLNRDRYEVFYDKKEVALSSTQFRILWLLVEAEGEIIPPKTLAVDALGYDVEEIEANDLIRGHISKIRHKLAVHAGDREHIRTIRNQGYFWVGQ